MRTLIPLVVSLAMLSACREAVESVPEGFCAQRDMNIPSVQQDMLPAAPPCPAARGLTGDNLLCVDFANPETKIDELKNKGLDFTASTTVSCPMWQTIGGILSIPSSNSYKGTCGFLLPEIKKDDYYKYNRFSLSIIQTLSSLDANEHKIQIMMGIDDPAKRLIDSRNENHPRQQRIFIIDKQDLPNGSSNSYQPLFKYTSNSSAVPAVRWQIESIAINGIP